MLFTRRPRPNRSHRRDLRDEFLSLCRAEQIERLALPGRILRDIGLDCGCDGPGPTRPRGL